MKSLSFGVALALGAVTIGVLDATCAMIRLAASQVPVYRAMQSVASGILGQSAFKRGMESVLLGTALHFLIALFVMLVYLLASRRLQWLNIHPWVSGIGYGLAVFVAMNFIVLPLSAVALSPRTIDRMLPGIAIHIIAVGLPAACIARLVRPAARAG